jgi:hypothetical protein
VSTPTKSEIEAQISKALDPPSWASEEYAAGVGNALTWVLGLEPIAPLEEES